MIHPKDALMEGARVVERLLDPKIPLAGKRKE